MNNCQKQTKVCLFVCTGQTYAPVKQMFVCTGQSFLKHHYSPQRSGNTYNRTRLNRTEQKRCIVASLPCIDSTGQTNDDDT